MPSRKVLLLCLAVTLCVVAWGYLVWSAIDFGSAARDGKDSAWVFLVLACLGAACCLFAGLMLGARVLRELGIMSGYSPPGSESEADPERLDGARPTLTVSPVVEAVPARQTEPVTGPAHDPEPTLAMPLPRDPAPAPREAEHPRGRRIADKAYHPDGPRQSGGRRIAR